MVVGLGIFMFVINVWLSVQPANAPAALGAATPAIGVR